MTVGNRMNSATGVTTTNGGVGTVIEKDQNSGFMPFKSDSVPTWTSTTTASAADAGVVVLSGTAGAVNVLMPLASTAPGALFIFRSNAAQAHVLTGTLEGQGKLVFTDLETRTQGSQLTLSGAISASVALLCDGASFMVIAARTGSVNTTAAFTINGT